MTDECKRHLKTLLGLDLKTSEEACENEKIKAFISAAIEKTNTKAVSRAAHIKKYRLLSTDFSLPGGELTPTLKLKRKVTLAKYQSLIDEMYVDVPKL